MPPLQAGWAVRRKSNHFAAYDQIADEFAQMLGLDPWFINPYFGRCGEVNFHERSGEECLATNVDFVLERMREKYREYDIADTPYVVVKADAGTYGMGVMTVRDASEVRGLNRKQRNKMAVIKEGLEVTEVIIQEGVPTRENVGRRGGRTCRLHDRPLRGGGLLSRAYRSGTRPEPQCTRNALCAAGFFRQLQSARLQCAGRRQCAEPLLLVRRDRASRVAGSRYRARGHGVETTRRSQRRQRRLPLRSRASSSQSSLPSLAAKRMALTWLFIVDPLDHLKEYKDSTVAMMREAARRGHIVHAGTPAELSFDSHDGLVRMQSHQLQITQQPDPWYVDQGLRDHPLNFYDAVLMRKDPPFDVEFLNATLLLSRAVAQGARVINDPQALRDHNEKLAVLEFPQYAVPTLVTRSIPGIRTFLGRAQATSSSSRSTAWVAPASFVCSQAT